MAYSSMIILQYGLEEQNHGNYSDFYTLAARVQSSLSRSFSALLDVNNPLTTKGLGLVQL